MKPRTVFTVSCRILTATGSALLTVTVCETDEDLVIRHQTNGELSYAFFAMKESTDALEGSVKTPSEPCTKQRMSER